MRSRGRENCRLDLGDKRNIIKVWEDLKCVFC